MENTEIKTLTKINGIGNYKAKLILNYCGTLIQAIQPNSKLCLGIVPHIAKEGGKVIAEQIKQLI